MASTKNMTAGDEQGSALGELERLRIAVLIPTCNGAASLRELLAALKCQTLQPDEILVVDSASADETLAVLGEYGICAEGIARDQFDHGGTRTAMAKAAQADILVFMTQDAIPATRHALQTLVDNLLAAPDIAAAYGRQLANHDASPIAAHLRNFNYPPESAVRAFSDRDRYGITTVFISNSFAAYRKPCLAAVDYFKNGLIFGEDTCTVGRLLLAGYRVAYASDATVYHSHNYSLIQEFKRSFDIGVLHRTEQWLLTTYGQAEGRGMAYVRSGLNQLFKQGEYLLLADFVLRVFVKLLGYKAGRMATRFSKKICMRLSMNPGWWQGNG